MTEKGLFPFVDINYEQTLEQVYETGAAYVPDFIEERALQEIVESLLPITAVSHLFQNERGRAIQIPLGDLNIQGFPHGTIRELEELIRSYDNKFESLSSWRANHFTLFHSDSKSQSKPHRDRKGVEGVGVTLSLTGSSYFSIHRTEDGQPFEKWLTRPGDAIFLRMEHFNPNVDYDHEVFHGTSKPIRGSHRTSLAIRQA